MSPAYWPATTITSRTTLPACGQASITTHAAAPAAQPVHCVRGILRLILALLLAAAWTTAPASPATECSHRSVLTIVAHMDDDLLFMNPDQESAIRQGACVRVFFLTAGDRGEGFPYLQEREDGIMAAYADMAQAVNQWRLDPLHLGGRTLLRYRLLANPKIELIALRLPDPWLGPGWGSLTPLSQVESVAGTDVRSYGPYAEHYRRGELVDLLAHAINTFQPTLIRIMDPWIRTPYHKLCWRCRGHDHPDHIASARLALEAMARAPGAYTFEVYLNYPSQELPANLTPRQSARKAEIFQRYMRFDRHYCPSADDCAAIRGPEAAWVQRQYQIRPLDQLPIIPAGVTDGRRPLQEVSAARIHPAHSARLPSVPPVSDPGGPAR